MALLEPLNIAEKLPSRSPIILNQVSAADFEVSKDSQEGESTSKLNLSVNCG